MPNGQAEYFPISEKPADEFIFATIPVKNMKQVLLFYFSIRQ